MATHSHRSPSSLPNCGSCGADIQAAARYCDVCQEDAGFPNVRQADQEHVELAKRYQDAISSANARDIGDTCAEFERAVETSNAVLCKDIKAVIDFLSNDRILYTTFHNQIAQGARRAETNKYDRGRLAAEHSILPGYCSDIVFAALSLTELGIPYYGNCHILLNSDLIAKRSSVFEENPFLFLERHNVIAGQAAPAGYRASWGARQLLAAAKLSPKLTKTSNYDDFCNIMFSGTGGDADFIEVHIFGPLHRKNVSKLTFVGVKSAIEAVLLESVRDGLGQLGVLIEEK